MAHPCIMCGSECYCHGDIDDVIVSKTPKRCEDCGCESFDQEDRDDESFDDNFDDDDDFETCADCDCPDACCDFGQCGIKKGLWQNPNPAAV